MQLSTCKCVANQKNREAIFHQHESSDMNEQIRKLQFHHFFLIYDLKDKNDIKLHKEKKDITSGVNTTIFQHLKSQ